MNPDFIMFCEGDTFCRCRVCKPSLDTVNPARVPSMRLVIGSTGLAVIVMLSVVIGAVQ